MARKKRSKSNPDVNALLALLHEQTAYMRYRSEAEHVYTAAAIAGIAALAAGILTVDPCKYADRCITNPALWVAGFIIFIAAAITHKIQHSHERWSTAKDSAVELANKINEHPKAKNCVPDWMLKNKPGTGHKLSIRVLWVAAVFAVAVCAVFYFSTLDCPDNQAISALHLSLPVAQKKGASIRGCA